MAVLVFIRNNIEYTVKLSAGALVICANDDETHRQWQQGFHNDFPWVYPNTKISNAKVMQLFKDYVNGQSVLSSDLKITFQEPPIAAASNLIITITEENKYTDDAAHSWIALVETDITDITRMERHITTLEKNNRILTEKMNILEQRIITLESNNTLKNDTAAPKTENNALACNNTLKNKPLPTNCTNYVKH